MIKILFVCHGNICRSPMAEFVMKDLVQKAGLESEYQIASAATSREDRKRHPPGNKGQAAGNEHPFPIAGRCAYRRRRQGIRLSIGMDRYNLRNMRAILREEDWHKISLLLDFCGESGDVE